ncbi:YIP1 family protein [Paracoccus albus]|uniref:YIP1 family protein n=1 Tax=Paracoccus albus TaxID=3017784 RepID=UPI0022F07BB5|nr:YIP1 family protein [Paracoccus albus]WBU61247.1 hypothetical protein PAF20_04890 [Paracoccus albus]
MNFDDFIGLLRLTFRNPAQAVRALQALKLPFAARWMALMVTVILSTLLMILVIKAKPDSVMPIIAGVVGQPIAYVILQLLGIAIASWLLTNLGRGVGGKADFPDVLLVITWIEVLLLSAQVVQSAALMISPLLSSLIGLATTVMIVWAAIQLLRAVQGISNPLVVILGLVASFMVTVFILSIVAAAFGLIPELPAEVHS